MTTPAPASSQRSYPSASAAAQAYLATSFRAQQAYLAALLLQQVLQIWGQLNLRDVRSSWPALETALEAVIQQQFTASAQAGNAYFLQARAAAGVPGPAQLPPLPVLERDLIRITLQVTGPRALLKRIREAQPPGQAVQTTGTVMGGAASRLVINGARQAVLQAVSADAKAVAWMRVTASDPCAYCAMLASRGPVYRTEQTAGFLAHAACRCVPQAVFSRADAKALRDNDLYKQWVAATRGYGGQDAINAWRRYWERAHPGVLGAPRIVA